MKRKLFITAAVLLAAAVLGCMLYKNQKVQNTSAHKPKVIATIFPQYDFARAIGGDRIDLSMLLRPGADSHSYAPSPQEVVDVQNCDLFIYVGGEHEAWAEKLAHTRSSNGTLRLIDQVSLLKWNPDEIEHMTGASGDHGEHEEHEHEHEGHEHEGDEEHEHDEHAHEYDEHIWTSPINAQKIASAIAERLALIDPENASFYRMNAEKYSTELYRLDEDFKKTIASSKRRVVVFGDRFPFRYMAKEYGLIPFSAFAGCTSDSEPSAASVAYLINKVKAENIPIVFHIELSNEKIADAICRETGARKLILHSCHNLSLADFEGGATYTGLMRKNLENLKEALN